MDMSGGHGGGNACVISMLWNWNTINTCFISSSWQITSTSMFAGSCIGVILLSASVEFLRRIGKEYERYILRQHQRSMASSKNSSSETSSLAQTSPPAVGKSTGIFQATALWPTTPQTFRPNILQQCVRATIHMLCFGAAYFVMLLAMYYNGYFIICILIGAWLGSFIFTWEGINLGYVKSTMTHNSKP